MELPSKPVSQEYLLAFLAALENDRLTMTKALDQTTIKALQDNAQRLEAEIKEKKVALSSIYQILNENEPASRLRVDTVSVNGVSERDKVNAIEEALNAVQNAQFGRKEVFGMLRVIHPNMFTESELKEQDTSNLFWRVVNDWKKRNKLKQVSGGAGKRQAEFVKIKSV